MKSLKIKGEKRKIVGRKVKTLRAEGVLPANIYGKGIKSESIKINEKEFLSLFKKAGETAIINIDLGGKTHPVLVHNVQVHPATHETLHVDFRQVNLKEKTKASVPIEIVGEAPAEKRGDGTLVQYINEIEVEALPTDFPEKFEIDANSLEKVDEAVFVKDMKFDKGKLSIELDPEEIIAKVEALREEEEAPKPVEAEEGEGEVEVEEGVEEGEKLGEKENEKAEEKETPKEE